MPVKGQPGIEKILGHEEIKGLLSVKEKERDTFVQTTQEEKEKNLEKIVFLRNLNDEVRKEISHHRSGGQHVVSKIFVARPAEKPLMKGKDLRTAAILMDQRAFENTRNLGKLNYELEQIQRRYGDKVRKLAELRDLLKRNPTELKVRTFLKNQAEAELVKMKLLDATNTATNYKKIIHALQKDIFETTQSITMMQQCKEAKIKMVNETHSIRDGAVKEFKQVMNEIKPLHALIDNKTRDFDEQLRKKRKEHVEQRRDTNMKCAGELKMDSHEDENPEIRKSKELQTITELKAFQDAFEAVKEALDISDVKDVLKRVQEEHLRYQRLCDQLEESNVLYDGLQFDLEDLRDQFAGLTYNPSASDMYEEEERKLAVEAERQMKRVQEALVKLAEKEKIISGIKLATIAIHSKLIYTRLPQNENAILTGEPAKDMRVIWSKAEKLIARYGTGNMEGEEHDDREQLKKFKEMRLPEDNLRCVLRPLDFRSRDDLRYDFDDIQAGYVSREDIKKRHHDIMKPKKRASEKRRAKPGARSPKK